MDIILEQKLIDHMEDNDLHDLVVEVGECVACGGGYLRANARFAEDGEKFSADEFDAYDTEVGKVYLPKEGVECGKSVRFVWKSYYWLDGLGVAGIEAVQKQERTVETYNQ